MSKTGVLHTSSIYGLKEIDLDFTVRTDESRNKNVTFLENQERKLYSIFGCNTFDEFITKLRSFFNPQDIEVLKRFEPSNLNNNLKRFASSRGTLYEENVEFVFNFSELNKTFDKIKFRDFLNIESNDSFKFKVLNADEKIFSVSFAYGPERVKTLLNKLFKDRHFVVGSSDMDTAEDRIQQLLGQGLEINLEKGKGSGDFSVEWQPPVIPNFPWGCTKRQYEEALKTNNIKILDEFKRAGEYIRYFIIDELCEGASPQLRTAVLRTWQKNFISLERDPALFFQGTTGSNFISSVQGSLGEFQAAVIFTLLDQSLIKKSNYATILGDALKRGEQLKTDVSIIEDLGLQVKNMNTITGEDEKLQLLRDLKTNIHPNKLSLYMDNPQQFLDFIANYYFNTTYQSQTEGTYRNIIRILGDYLGELMNFSMAEQISDTVSFYFISGKYLVPASHILKAAEELNLKDSITITSSYTGKTDEEYKEPIYLTSAGRLSPEYVKYWTHTYGDQTSWHPTGRNFQTYNYLISRLISIRTRFNLFDKIANYAIF